MENGKDMKGILQQVQSLQRRIKRCDVTMSIDYCVNEGAKASIDVFVHSQPGHCEMFSFSWLDDSSDHYLKMYYLKSHLKDIKAFKLI